MLFAFAADGLGTCPVIKRVLMTASCFLASSLLRHPTFHRLTFPLLPQFQRFAVVYDAELDVVAIFSSR